MKNYKTGFTVRSKHPFFTEEWLFQEGLSSDTKLVFYGYDANLYATPNFSERPDTDWKDKVVKRALEFTSEFDGEVWLDDVCVKNGEAIK